MQITAGIHSTRPKMESVSSLARYTLSLMWHPTLTTGVLPFLGLLYMNSHIFFTIRLFFHQIIDYPQSIIMWLSCLAALAVLYLTIVSSEWELTLTDPIQNPRLILWPILWLIPWLTLSLAQWLTLLLLWCQGFALWQCNRCILLSTVVTEKSSWNKCVQPHFLGSINSIENLIHSFRKLPFWTITDSGNISLHFHKICEVVLFKCDYFFFGDSYAIFLCKYIFGYSLMARFLQMPPAKIAGSTFNSTKKLDKILSQENPEDFKRTSE